MFYHAVHFNKNNNAFVNTLRQRVNAYFIDNQISKQANAQMIIKSFVMLGLYFVPFGILLSDTINNPWMQLGLWLIMAVGMSGIGLGIMHDANHGAYSKSKRTNDLIGMVINLAGVSQLNWKIQLKKVGHNFRLAILFSTIAMIFFKIIKSSIVFCLLLVNSVILSQKNATKKVNTL